MLDVLLYDAEISAKLKKEKVCTYNEALKFVNNLPYGRNESGNFLSILDERKGTCSTKHAFLAYLAQGNQLPIRLMFGYYPMNRENTPQIGDTLRNFGLPYILEGHCYLRFYDEIIDVTFPGEIKNQFDFDLIEEQEISPFALSEKPLRHMEKLKKWLKNHPAYPIQDFEKL